jgi:4-amino-4-deoxy-L-arabinose transferase-like glycosyltransferase
VAAQKVPERSGWLGSPLLDALVLLTAAFGLRLWTFGDPNLFVDDQFYFLVGQRMHEGALPYVDIWDRKPLGLFLIYYGIAAISTSVLAYQIVATLFAAATAWMIGRIVLTLGSNRQGAILAGITYLVVICPMGGVGGQSPVFYNLLIAAAALLVTLEFDALERGRIGWRIWAAMTLCGLAATIKQTTIFESLFLGGYVLLALWRAGVSARSLTLIALAFGAIGIAPTAAISCYYAAVGHWTEYWHAMIVSNLNKSRIDAAMIWQTSALALLIRAVFVISLGIWGLVQEKDRRTRRFLTGWLFAAAIGFLAVPNFFVHYILPVLVPVSVATGLIFDHRKWGRVMFVATLAYYQLWYNPLDFAWSHKSAASMGRMAVLVRAHDSGGGLLVYDGPPYLYSLSGKAPPSALAFPHHFNHAIEKDVSHLNTSAELQRVIARGPGVVVISLYPRSFPVNVDSYRRIRRYVQSHCQIVGTEIAYELEVETPIVIFGDCRPPAKAG